MTNPWYKYFKALKAQVDALSSGPGTGDMTKAVYDPTTKNTNAFSMTNMDEGTTNKIFTATERTKLAGIADGANNYTHPAGHDAAIITAGTIDGDRLPAMSATKKGGVPLTGTPSGKFLKDDSTWSAPTASVAITEVEIDCGATPVIEAIINVTNAGISAASKILGGVAYKAPTGKDLDELECDAIELKFEPLAGSFNVHIKGLEGYISDKFIVWYLYA